jgi:DNA-binding NarL/FixJ family response regulator
VSAAAAREAYDQGAWQSVLDVLGPDRSRLDPDELEMLAEAAWWLGDSPGSMTASEQLFQQLLERGETSRAAERAIQLGVEWAIRGDLQVSSAWLTRARRLLRELPESATHGYLAYLQALDPDPSGDPGAAEAAAAEVERIMRRFPEPALRSFSLVLRGLAELRRGRTDAGFDFLEEAMLPVLAGQVGPLWSGDIHCMVIHQCERLGDLARMRAWTGSLARWSSPLPTTFLYARVTRVHELQLLAAEGDWDTVERELGEQSDGLVSAHGWLAGEGFYCLGEVRRLRGDTAGARQAYDRARSLGFDAQPGAALLLHAEGRAQQALADLRVTLADLDRLERTRLLRVAVELGLRQHQRDQADALAAELEETAAWFGTPGLRADAARARAAVLLADGQAEQALPLLSQAAAILREQRCRYATAAVHEQLAAAHRALGRRDRGAADEATARAIYTRLGARPDVARLTEDDRPGGLTERELEVLDLVSRGASNQEVADALTISRKTVGRHLSNIFAKIDVSSRTSAAAWAREHGL